MSEEPDLDALQLPDINSNELDIINNLNDIKLEAPIVDIEVPDEEDIYDENDCSLGKLNKNTECPHCKGYLYELFNKWWRCPKCMCCYPTAYFNKKRIKHGENK